MPPLIAPTQLGAFPRDDNAVPITNLGLLASDTQSLTTTGTVHVPIFTIAGTIQVNALYGVVTSDLGNCTATYWRFNDQTTQSNITVNTGTSLTNAKAGSTIVKKDLASAALTLLSASQERVSEPTTLETMYFSPFFLQAKPGALSQIEFTYTTSDDPTTGTIQFFLGWVPLSSGASVTPV